MSSRKNYAYLGAAWVLFGLAALYLAAGDSGVPERAALASATGPVQSVIKGKSSVGFSLKGDAHRFQHSSKSGVLPAAYQALSSAGGEIVTVLYDPAQSWQPPFDDKAYHAVYEIRISDRTLLSYEQARGAWQTNQGLGKWLGVAFVLIGVALVAFARLRGTRR